MSIKVLTLLYNLMKIDWRNGCRIDPRLEFSRVGCMLKGSGWCKNLFLCLFYLLLYLNVFFISQLCSCHFIWLCWYILGLVWNLVNSPICTNCLITWHPYGLCPFCSYDFFTTGMPLVWINFHLDCEFFIRPKYGSCPFYERTRKPLLVWSLVLLIIGFSPLLIQGFDPSWYLVMFGVMAWHTYWARLVI